MFTYASDINMLIMACFRFAEIYSAMLIGITTVIAIHFKMRLAIYDCLISKIKIELLILCPFKRGPIQMIFASKPVQKSYEVLSIIRII